MSVFFYPTYGGWAFCIRTWVQLAALSSVIHFCISSGPDCGQKTLLTLLRIFYQNDRMNIYILKLVRFTWISVYNSHLCDYIYQLQYISDVIYFSKKPLGSYILIGCIYMSKSRLKMLSTVITCRPLSPCLFLSLDFLAQRVF